MDYRLLLKESEYRAVRAELAHRAFIAARARGEEAAADFATFVDVTTPGYLWGWFNREVCRELQSFLAAIERGERPRLMLCAPPRHGKTELVSRKFPAYVLGKHPDWPIIATSYSDDLASRNNVDLQRVIDSEAYSTIFPETRLRSTTARGKWFRTSSLLEIVNKGGSYRSAGVGGSITGMGARVIIIDDPIKDAASAESETVLEAVWNWYQGTLYTRQDGPAGILLIMTRWNLGDPAGRLIDEMRIEGKDQWRVVSFPAIAEEDEAHRRAGEALHPERFPLATLRSIETTVGSYFWSALYQQRPTPREGGIFKPGRMPIETAGDPGKIVEWVRGWDFASSKSRGDWTVGTLIGRTQERRYVVADVVRFRGTPEEVEARLVTTAHLDGPRVRQSLPKDPGQAAGTQVLYFTRALAGYTVTSSPESGSKVTRAEPFASQCNVGNVTLTEGAWNRDYVEELRNFPNGVYDDQVDASSRAFMELLEAPPSMRISDEVYALAVASRRKIRY